MGTGWPALVHPDDIEKHVARRHASVASGEPFESEARYRGADGEYRWFLVRAVPLRDEHGSIMQWYGVNIDIEDAKRAQLALSNAADRLQHLSRRLMEVQEEERRRLARELHDEFGQILATVSLHLHAAKGVAGERARANLDMCMELLQRAGTQVRSLALELRPTMLETAGLDAALFWLAEQHLQQTGIAVHVACNVHDVSGDVAIACFRVAQEALTNVVRHAGAHNVWIELTEVDSSVRLTVRDDGAGFDVPKALKRAAGGGRLGLLGMRERVQILGGRLYVDSDPGRGTRIDVSLPVKEPVGYPE